MSDNDDNSRIQVYIHEDDDNINPLVYNDDHLYHRRYVANLFEQPISFSRNAPISFSRNTPIEEINRSINQFRMLNVMTAIFGGEYEDRLASAMEDQMMGMAMRESLSHYKTQEKKPNIKLDVESRQALDEHTSETCAICKDDFELNDNITSLECKHILHTDCIAEWVKYKSECPVCRGKIKTVDSLENKEDGDIDIDN